MPIPTLPRLPMASEFLTWAAVEQLIGHLVPQLRPPYDALLMITRGGIVPGGLIAEALDIRAILTAAVEFPAGGRDRLAWPTFLQFPSDALLRDQRVLIVDDLWAHGRTITAVKGRVQAAGASAEVAVLHYKPGANLFREAGPTYYAAITDRFIVYPWEAQRSSEPVYAGALQPN